MFNPARLWNNMLCISLSVLGALFMAVLVSIAYAFLLYRSSGIVFSKRLRYMLFVLRACSIAVLTYLLFAPWVRLMNKRLEKPLIIIAQDNSASISRYPSVGFNLMHYTQKLRDLIKVLSEEYDVKILSFGQGVSADTTFTFKEQQTDISALFGQINDSDTHRNIGAVVLASDGVYTRGGDPHLGADKLKSPVYTIALGDTLPKKDIWIEDVRYNEVVQEGNQFQIEVDVNTLLCQGSTTKVTVYDSDGEKVSRTITVNTNEYHSSVPVVLNARRKGTQIYTVRIDPVSGEITDENNTKTIAVEVIDGLQKILLIAHAPHPDISAIKQSIEENKNYRLKVLMVDAVNPTDISSSDAIILHQLPAANHTKPAFMQQLGSKPVWFILGHQSDFSAFSATQSLVNIQTSGSSAEEIYPQLNSAFYAFTLSEEAKNQIQRFSPLTAPSAAYNLKGTVSVLLSHRNTKEPLLLFGNDKQIKTAILTAEGIWRWKLDEFKIQNNHQVVNELINKTVQYLSAKRDERKFKVYPEKISFEENQSVFFNAELYNQADELVNDPVVKMEIKRKDKPQVIRSFVFSKKDNAYTLSAGKWAAGNYIFHAYTVLDGKKQEYTGEFVVTLPQAEFVQTRANHRLLFTLSQQSNGKMISPDQIEQLPELLRQNEMIKTIAYEDERYEDLINLKLIFFIILVLISTEWFLRKRSGGL